MSNVFETPCGGAVKEGRRAIRCSNHLAKNTIIHLCVRGSRKPFRSENEVVNDFRLSVNAAEVFLN